MITWKIESMIVKPQDGSHTDVVVTAGWTCTARQGDYSAGNYGTVGFSALGDVFTPYESLTEDEVLGWCYANGLDREAVEANVTRELADKIDPPVVSKPLPWTA